MVPTPAQSQPSSTALRKGDTEFVAWVNTQLTEYYKSGQTQKWYEQALKEFGLDPKLRTIGVEIPDNQYAPGIQGNPGK